MLSLYAKQEIQRLQSQTNHSLDLDDFDDIVKMDALCNAITSKDAPHNDIVDMPVVLGRYELKQPTIGVLEWYNDYYLPLFENNALMADAGLAYALSLSDTPEELWLLKNKRDARKHVKRFLRRLNCTHDELQDVLRSLLSADENAESDEESEGNAGALIAMLCREYGHSPQYWLWEAPVGIVNAFVADYAGRIEAETEQIRNASKGANKPPPAESRKQKFLALREHTNMMRDKWQKM